MTNGELIAILQRFPPEGLVKVRRHGATPVNSTQDIDRAEMAIDPSPQVLKAQNVSWADLVKEKIQVVLIYDAPPPTVLREVDVILDQASAVKP